MKQTHIFMTDLSISLDINLYMSANFASNSNEWNFLTVIENIFFALDFVEMYNGRIFEILGNFSSFQDVKEEIAKFSYKMVSTEFENLASLWDIDTIISSKSFFFLQQTFWFQSRFYAAGVTFCL